MRHAFQRFPRTPSSTQAKANTCERARALMSFRSSLRVALCGEKGQYNARGLICFVSCRRKNVPHPKDDTWAVARIHVVATAFLLLCYVGYVAVLRRQSAHRQTPNRCGFVFHNCLYTLHNQSECDVRSEYARFSDFRILIRLRFPVLSANTDANAP